MPVRCSWAKPNRLLRTRFSPRLQPVNKLLSRSISQRTRCMPHEVEGDQTNVLQEYLKPLEEDERTAAVSKFIAAGFVRNRQSGVLELGNQQLKEIGIEPQALRTDLLKRFKLIKQSVGPEKTIIVEDDMGAPEKVMLCTKHEFEVWQRDNGGLKVLLPDGRTRPVVSWERLHDGATYYKSETLTKQVKDLRANQATWNGSLEEMAAEKGLSIMLPEHPEAKRLCGVRVLKNKTGQQREYDAIIVADNCILIMEAKAQVDLDAVVQLDTAMDFAREAAQQGADSFAFARRPDGSVKDLKGAVAGLIMVPGESQQSGVKRLAKKLGCDIYLVNGNGLSLGNSCQPPLEANPNMP